MNYRYNIGCSLTNLKRIREFVRNSLREQRIAEPLLNTLVLAMDEVCSNVIIHAHRCNPGHFIEILISRSEKKTITFEIVDDGDMFDINEFQGAAVSTLINEKKKGGLGIRLVKSIMDKIEYEVREGKNVCRLIKNIAR